MAKCAYCGTTILFGGKKAEDLKFCNDKCLSNGRVVLASREVPNNVVTARAREIQQGPCPVCTEMRGPVDVRTSHKIASFILMTSWSSTPRIYAAPAARRCNSALWPIRCSSVGSALPGAF